MEAATMIETLNFYDELLLRVRRLHEAGQWHEALGVLARLVRLGELPPNISAEARARQGEILLKKRRYRSARRHLRAALQLRPESARLHFLLGLALHGDPGGNREKAARHYARSLELAPSQTRCRAEAGLLAIELGRTEEGLAMLRQTVEQAPGDAVTIARLVKGLFESGRPEEALSEVRKALFQFPRSPLLRKLWLDLQFAGVRRQQVMMAAGARGCDDGPVILPFVPAAESNQPARTPWRRDDAEPLLGPHLVRIRARVSRRRAP
jgi:tetratricopeptide (TPR) repeat protein